MVFNTQRSLYFRFADAVRTWAHGRTDVAAQASRVEAQALCGHGYGVLVDMGRH